MPRRGTKKQKNKNKKTETQTKVRMAFFSMVFMVFIKQSLFSGTSLQFTVDAALQWLSMAVVVPPAPLRDREVAVAVPSQRIDLSISMGSLRDLCCPCSQLIK